MAAMAASPCNLMAIAIAAEEVGSESARPIRTPITGARTIAQVMFWFAVLEMMNSIETEISETI